MFSALGRAYEGVKAVRAPDLSWAIEGADRVRARGLRMLPRGGAALWVGRERRAAVLGVGLLAVALGLSVTVPVALLAVGPIVYGVPHILSDVRYLVARPGLSRRPFFLGALAIGCALGAAGLGVRGAVIGAALALVSSRAPAQRKVIGGIAAAGIVAGCTRVGWVADLVFVHVHNFVGVAIWLLWRERGSRLHFGFLGLFFVGCAAIALGAAGPIVGRTGGFHAPWTDLTFEELAWSVSPVTSGAWAERLLVLFAFAQAAHYVVWLRLMPEDDRPSGAPRSYRQTYRALVRDLGGALTWAALLAALGLFVWAFASVGRARTGYLNAAFFHAHLEVIAITVLWGEGRWPFGEGRDRGAKGAAAAQSSAVEARAKPG